MIAPSFPYNKLIEVTDQEFAAIFVGYTTASLPKFTEIARTSTTHIMIASSINDDLGTLPACTRSATAKWTGATAVIVPELDGNNPLIKHALSQGYATVQEFLTAYGINL